MTRTEDFTMICKICGYESNNQFNYELHRKACERIAGIKDKIFYDYNDGLSQQQIKKKYGIQTNKLVMLLKRNNIPVRDRKAGYKTGRERFPEAGKAQSEETKQKIREARLKWMKENPEKTAWRLRKQTSYPAKLFMKICDDLSLYDKYDIVQEYCVFPFYIDFAFANIKVAVEVDGSQHWKDPKTIERDIRKERLLTECGWRILRIPDFKLKESYTEVANDLRLFLENFEIRQKKYDSEIIQYEQIIQEKNRKKQVEKELKANKTKAEHMERLISRKSDFEKVYPKAGWSVELGNMWGIRSQKAAAYCKKYFDIREGHAMISKEELLECMQSKMSTRAIAKKFNMGKSTVLDYYRKYNLEIPEPINKVDWNGVDLPKLLETKNYSQIAKELGVTPRSVTLRAKKLGLK